MVPHWARGHVGALEREAADRLDQAVGERRQDQPELVGPPVLAGGAVGEQVQLLFFDAVLHLAALAVERVVELPARAPRGWSPHSVGWRPWRRARGARSPGGAWSTSRRRSATRRTAAASRRPRRSAAPPSPSTARPDRRAARSWPSRRCNRPRDARTRTTSCGGRSPNPRAGRCGHGAKLAAAASPAASISPRHVWRRRCSKAADSSPAADRRRTHRAAGSSSNRSSRERTVPLVCHAPHRRWRRSRAPVHPAPHQRRR